MGTETLLQAVQLGDVGSPTMLKNNPLMGTETPF